MTDSYTLSLKNNGNRLLKGELKSLPITSEKLLYPEVVNWFQKSLESLFRNASVSVYDTHAEMLNKIIISKGFQRYFDNEVFKTFNFRIDITGFIFRKRKLGLAFVEYKTMPISLAHVNKLVSHCQIVNPLVAYLISPKGAGGRVISIIQTYNKSDILEYNWEKGRFPRRIFIAKWNELSRNIDIGSLLPSGVDVSLSSIE